MPVLVKQIRILHLFVILLITVSCSTAQQTSDSLSIVYTGKSLDISAETGNARATTWHPDGISVYLVGRDTQNVVRYDLTEPWDISTATFYQEFDLSGATSSSPALDVPHGVYIHDEGALMWVFHRTEMWGYELSVPWDITTANMSSHADLSAFVQRGHDVDFNPDGTRLFIDDRNDRSVHEVSLSTPWDISTFTHEYTLDISDQEKEVRGTEFIHDGRTLLLLDTVRRAILRYSLSEPYNLQTAKYTGFYDVSDNTTSPRGLSVHPDQRTVYITGRNNQRIYQYIMQD